MRSRCCRNNSSAIACWVHTGARTCRPRCLVCGRLQAILTTWQRVSVKIRAGRPGRSRSRSDSRCGDCLQRAFHFRTTRSLTPSRSAVPAVPAPAASRRIICARTTKPCSRLRLRATSLRRRCSLRETQMLPLIRPVTQHQHVGGHIYFRRTQLTRNELPSRGTSLATGGRNGPVATGPDGDQFAGLHPEGTIRFSGSWDQGMVQ